MPTLNLVRGFVSRQFARTFGLAGAAAARPAGSLPLSRTCGTSARPRTPANHNSRRNSGAAGADSSSAGGIDDIPIRRQTGTAVEKVLPLADVLERELAEEHELVHSEEKPQELEENAKAVQQIFTVKEQPGSSLVQLHGKHGNEKIFLQFDCQDTTEDELDEEVLQNDKSEEYSIGVRGFATISRGQQKMIFSLVFTNTVWIERVAFDNQGRNIDDDTIYWSDVSEYPEDMRDAFSDYLAERRIDDDLALFVSYHADEKEKLQYADFLKDVKTFIAGR